MPNTADLKEASKHVSELSIAIHRLNDANAGMAKGFAEFSSAGNKAWTVISRFLSGTGLWALQNQFRAIGNTLEVYYLNQTKQMEQQMKTVESNMALADSYANIKKNLDNLEKSDYYTMLKNSEEFSKTEMLKFSREFYEDLVGKMDKGMEKQKKGLRKLFDPDLRKRVEEGGIMKEVFSPFEKVAEFISGPLEAFDWLEIGEERDPEKAGWKDMVKKIKQANILKNMGNFLKDSLAFLGKAMVWFLLIATGVVILVAIIKKLWPHIKETLEANFHHFKNAFMGLLKILGGMWDSIKAVFRGDIAGVFKAFFGKILPGIIELLGNLLMGVIGLVLGIAKRLVMGIVNWVADSWVGKMLNLKRHQSQTSKGNLPQYHGKIGQMQFEPTGVQGMASGGLVTKGGLFMVGERGAELVSLPAGARVHNNQQSQNMGNTININVSGSMGTSDAELRRLADKLGNEINKRVNRTVASPTGF